jgi:hypothetical protein
MKLIKPAVFILLFLSASLLGRSQYVEKERDDTIRLMAKTPFDTVAARNALGYGSSAIKGVAFTKQKNAWGMRVGARIYANRIKVLLFPETPYLLEYLELKKKENYKKLKIAYLSKEAWYYHYEAITNSVGEFTFPNLKPGRYYLEGVLDWNLSGSYDAYSGSSYNGYGTTNYYDRRYYNVAHSDLLQETVEIKNENEVIHMKLK